MLYSLRFANGVCVDISPYYVSKNKKGGAQGGVFRHHRPARSTPIEAHLPETAEMLLESAAESNCESYRSVIDDLTVKSTLPTKPEIMLWTFC